MKRFDQTRAGREDSQQLRAILDCSAAGILVVNDAGQIVFANPAAGALLGSSQSALLGTTLDAPLVPCQVTELERPDAGADVRTLELNVTAFEWHGEPAWLVCVSDITRRKRGEAALRAQARQQAAVAGLGELALQSLSLPELRDAAATLICDVFGVEFSTVLEYLADSGCARLVAGVGWRDGLVGQDTIPVDPESQAGTALLCAAPVVVADWREEQRFRGADVLHEHGVISGINVIIPGENGSWVEPWGVLGAHASWRRKFTSDDINFMQSVANVLAQATQRARALSVMRESDILLQVAGRTARLGGWEVDPRADRVTWSDEVCAIHDVPPGTTLTLAEGWKFYTPESGERANRIARACLRDGESFDEEMEIVTAQGRRVWVRTIGEPVRDDDGRIVRARGALQDITERKRAESEINFLALYDPLTRLPNRRLLQDRLQQALTASLRSGHKGAVVFLDLDNFKTLNDTLGHDEGDLLLQQVAARLNESLRKGDTVARFGGDEFVLVIGGLGETDAEAAVQAESLGDKLLATLNRPYRIGRHERHSTPSIGITVFGKEGDGVAELLKQADFAMYQAKARGRNRLRLFDPEMQAAVSARVALENEMRRGLKRGEFYACYQPQVDADGRMTGAEALARWRHPRRGVVSPAEFIPLAEETGLILSLGRIMLETACEQLARWAERADTAPLSLAVNVSAQQLHHPDFVRRVTSVIERSGADPRRLKLELTESSVLQDVEDTVAKMTALGDYGIAFSLDDFGTGYSSLYYLKRLPLAQLKIDQRFVKDVLANANDAAIARTILVLAQSLGLEAIAEGVETAAVRDFLAEHGCLAYQGYLFSRPLPIEQFEAFLEQARNAG